MSAEQIVALSYLGGLRPLWFSVLGGGVATAWIAAGRLVAATNHPVGPPPVDLPMEAIRIEGESASRVSGWHLAAPEAIATVIAA